MKILRRRCFDALPTAPPRLFTFSQENSGSGGNASFPNFCTFKRQEREFFFNFHHWPSLKFPAGNKIRPSEYNWLCFSITIRKAKFIFTPKIAEIFSMFKCYISVELNLAYHIGAKEIGLVTKPVRFILPSVGVFT